MNAFLPCGHLAGAGPLHEPWSAKDDGNISRSMYNLNHAHPIFRGTIEHQI